MNRPKTIFEATQPQFIDCQRELLGIVPSYKRRIARLRTWLAAWIIAAVGGWAVVGIIIWMRANN